MSNFVSMLAAVGAGAPAAGANFPARPRGAEASPAFSSALERAVQRAPERKRESTFDRSARNRTTQTEAAEAGARSERREFARAKNRSNPRDEEHSLAGAAAVNGQGAKLEAPASEVKFQTSGFSGRVAGESAGEATPKGFGATMVTDDAASAGAALAGNEADGDATTVTAPLLKATPAPSGELENLLSPMNAAELAAADGELKLPSESALTNPASSPGAPTQASTKVAPALSSDVGAVAPAGMVGDDLNPAATAEVAQAIAPTSAEARHVTRAVRRSLDEALESARGTGGAKSTETMKTAMDQEKIAGLGEQLLPHGSALPVSALSSLPGEARLGPPGGGAEAMLAAAKLAPAPTRADVSGAGDLLDLRATAPLVRVSELVSREVRMFKRAGDDLVEVVLTPDAKTQISLRLQWREGQVEVQARCDLGDHQSLSQQWPQLQAALAQHGVRLSHLNERAPTGFTEFFNNPSFSQQQGGERRPAGSAAGADLPVVSGPHAAKSAPAQTGVRGQPRTLSGFDSWA